jgi:hypothetical protein
VGCSKLGGSFGEAGHEVAHGEADQDEHGHGGDDERGEDRAAAADVEAEAADELLDARRERGAVRILDDGRWWATKMRLMGPAPSIRLASLISFGRFCRPPRKIRNPRLEIHGNPTSKIPTSARCGSLSQVGWGSPTAPRIRSIRPEPGWSRYAQTSISTSGGSTIGSTRTYLATVAARRGMWVTISAAVNWATRLIAMLPPTRMPRFLASVPKVGAWMYCRNCDIPA